MRKYITLILIFISAVLSQNKIKIDGTITYLSSQNVYVKFDAPENIVKGDTLYFENNGKLEPAVLVQFLSSSSVAGQNISASELKIGDKIIAVIDFIEKNVPQKKDSIEEPETGEVYTESVDNRKNDAALIRGRLSLSSYSNLTNRSVGKDYQRWRYVFSLSGDKLLDNRVSFDSYINFSYRADEWGGISDNFGRALKIYSLALNYKITDDLNISIGRRINRKISNLGAFDGINAEYQTGNYFGGIVLGSRPNFYDYGFNAKLFEYAGYFGRTDTLMNGFMENSISVILQTNNFKTDRRFLYFQHSNTIFDNISLFFSSEVDLYEKKSGVERTTFNLTSLYLLTRYAPVRWLSLSASYDARKNVIYFETYKNFADSLLEQETRQGLRLRLTIRPINYVFISGNYGYRFRSGDLNPSNNFGFTITHSRIPVIDISTSFNFINLATSYLNGKIYGFRLNKQLFNLFNTGLGFRRVEYIYTSSHIELNQNIFSAELGLRFLKDLFLSVSYEGIFEKESSYGRIFANLTARF